MLTFTVTPYSPDPLWRFDTSQRRYTSQDGQSFLAPVRHTLLENLALTDGARTLLVVRERATGRATCEPGIRVVEPSEFDDAVAQAQRWPLDFVTVLTEPGHPAIIQAGPRPACPLYLAHDGRSVHGTWEMGDLRRFATGIENVEAARLLIYKPRYTHQTLFTGIFRLTERSTAYFGGDLYLRYPAPALHAAARELVDGADVLNAFDTALDLALTAHPIAEAATWFHLSGGFDSATLATRAAAANPGAYPTSALLIGGPGRTQQERRRAKLRAAAPFAEADVLIDAMDRLPLDPECVRAKGLPISPYEEALHNPFRLLTAAMADAGAQAVVTGLGGDEMVALTEDERAHSELIEVPVMPWLGTAAQDALAYGDIGIAPPALVNNMTLLSMETTAPILLRQGIYPMHPFTHPALVDLGEQLPYDWRLLKQLHRRRLARLGLDGDVVLPVHRESFAEVVRAALTSHGVGLLRALLRTGSPLIERRLVDPDQLAAAVTRLEAGSYSENRESQLLEVIDLHLAAVAFL